MFEDGTKTVFAKQQVEMEVDPENIYDAIYEYIEYAKELDSRNLFKENLVKYLNKTDSEKDYSTVENSELRKEIAKRYKATGLEELPKSVKNWLEGTPPGLSRENRINMYNFCIAMGMNVEETKEFFLKAFLTIPFDFKDIVDATYYYGVSNKKEYKDINKLITEITDLVKDKNPVELKENKETKKIGIDISDIHNDDVFKEYIIGNHIDSEKSFRTAKKYIMDFLVTDAQLAQKEMELLEGKAASNKFFKENSDVVIAELLNWIFCSEETISLKEIEGLPKRFKSGFPRAMELSEIINDKASSDVYRKALIVLNFYAFFGDILFKDHIIQRDEEEIREDFDDFHAIVCKNLEESGFVQLYYRNPFDWLILFCARQENPIEVFRQCLSGE